MVGVAIATSSIAVGSRCPWVRAKIGAVSTQNITLPSLGPAVLDAIEAGFPVHQAVSTTIDSIQFKEYRQIIAIDAQGNTAIFNGARSLGIHASEVGTHCVAAGNLLNSVEVPATMARSFEANADHTLAERLLLALEAGLYDAGGEMGPVHSAALLVAGEHLWPLADLRIDWSDDDPVRELRQLWAAYQPQMADFVKRAIDPSDAPSFGVPGDA